MIFIVKVITALVIFGLIILVHEFGHFIVAKACGVKVIEFSLGMGPRLFTVHGASTDYSLKLFPIGGSCEMKGETDEDDDPDDDSFSSKKPWQRFLIIFAGPAFNFILSFLVAAVLVSNTGTDIPLISDVVQGMPAEAAGIMPGDEVISINGRRIHLYREITIYNVLHEGQYQEIIVKRGDSSCTFQLVPEYSEEYGRYMIGIVGSGEAAYPAGFFDLMKYSYYELRYNVLLAVDSLIYLFNGHFTPDNVMGPVGIISNISDTVEQTLPYGLKILLLTMAQYILLFGTNIGVLNLVPFPALDGGRLLLIIIEMIIGRPVNKRIENYINFAGFIILMALILVISINDIGRLL